ncbi:MAG: TrkH family potassium uptake protein [Faecalibacterium sp.]
MGTLLQNKVKRMTYPQIIAIGYFFIILIGAGLLCLPIASRAEGSLPLLSALFTATSATCVTGLAVGDTYQLFTGFGQAVILFLIQIGGLGFMTIIIMFSFAFKKRIGLRTRTLLKESVNSTSVGGIVRLFHKVLLGTLLFEGVGALLLATRFIPRYGLWQGLWFSVFHSVSAFCNAGFDLMGVQSAGSSLVYWADDPVVCITIALLIMIGGIGFFVWADIQSHGLRFKKYQLHTKLVLTVSGILVVGGTLLFLAIEWNHTLANMPLWQKLLDAFFCAVTPRTAGFNVVDTTALQSSAKMLTIMLMFIGGSTGGTAGGVKTTTLAALVISAFDTLRGMKDTNVFGRRLEVDVLRRANAIFSVNIFGVSLACFMMMVFEPQLPLSSVLFEVVSAIGTVGLSVGVTGSCDAVGLCVLMVLMYAGRVGSMSFALLFTEQRSQPAVRCPEEKISIG